MIFSDDPRVHLKNLKTTPEIEEVATSCVECGFCEPVCPSRDLTTTPRQRIVLRREMARQAKGSPVLRALVEEFEYDAIETCAADGTCMLACPVGIDTGKLVKGLRADRAQRAGRAGRAAARGSLGGGRGRDSPRARRRRSPGLGRAVRAASRATRRALSSELAPEWPREHAPACAVAAADDAARGRRGRLPAGLREPDLRPRAQRRPDGRPEPRGGAGDRFRASGARALDPAGRRRPLLRDPVDLEGLRGRSAADGEPRPSTPCGAGRTAGGCRSSATRARARSGSPPRRSRC